MLRGFFRQKHKLFMALSVIVLLVNTYSVENAIVGLFAALLFLWSTSNLLGPVFAPNQTRATQAAIGFISILSVIAIVGSVLYYIGPVFKTSFVVLIVVLGLASTLFGENAKTREEDEKEKPQPMILAATGVIILALAAWWSAIGAVSVESSIRTPWDAVNPVIIIAITIAIFVLGLLLHTKRATALNITLFGVTLFSTLALAVVIYPLGFGFDPFIHRATVAHIASVGTITPKPLYYIGQYALELTAFHVFSLPLHLVDRLLVPLLAAIIIPLSAGVGFIGTLKRKGLPALLAVFLLPLAAFVVTTPQSLAYIFTIALLFLSLPRLQGEEDAPHLVTLGVITAAALITHPLAGIPAVIYFVLVSVASIPKPWPKTKAVLTTLLPLLGAVSLPAVFILQAAQSGLGIQLAMHDLFNWEKLGFTGFLGNEYSSIFDGLYLVIDNLLWILLILAAVGFFYAKKHKANPYLHLPLIAAIMWIVNYWLLSTTLEFNFLIEYERQNYSARLLTLAAIFLIPHAGIGIAGVANTLRSRSKSLRLGWILLITALISANVYATYPRHDNYARSAGYNVASSDFDAVYAIETRGGDEDFIVLANQAVSAAALEAFGFKQYFDGDIFYYPIPTGGELYQFYLDMTDIEPTRERAIGAMDLAGVDTAYFVVNDYWWRSDVIIERAKNEADEWFSVGDGSVTIFIYNR